MYAGVRRRVAKHPALKSHMIQLHRIVIGNYFLCIRPLVGRNTPGLSNNTPLCSYLKLAVVLGTLI